MVQNKVQKLIEQREQHYNETTTQLFNQIKFLTDVVEEHLQQDDYLDQMYISWEDINLSMEHYPERGGTLILVGSVNDNDTDSVKSFLHFGVPMDVLDWDKDDIKQFLVTLDDPGDEQDLVYSPNDDEDIELHDQNMTDDQQTTQSDWSKTFDLDRLTTKQRDHFKLYNLTEHNRGSSSN